jgi:hypothetical protein
VTHTRICAALFLYILVASASADNVSIIFLKQDYTSQWGDSILHAQGNVTGGWYDLFNSSWQVGGTAGPAVLTANWDYKILITKSGNLIDKGIIRFQTNGTLPIQISQPIITYGSTPIDGLTLAVYQNQSQGKLYCFYNVSASLNFTLAVFNVYNATQIPPVLLYTANDPTDYSATFQYTIPNVNDSYKVDCIVTIGGYGYSKTVTFVNGNSTQRFLGPTFPMTPMGYSIDDIFKGLVLFLVIFVFGIASMVNASIIALFAVGLLWLFYYWNWVTMNPILLGFLLVFAVVYRLKQSKEGKG